MAHALVEINTPTNAQVIHFFAFFTFSSSPHDTKYIIPAITREITEITATYLIPEEITFHKNEKKFFPVIFCPTHELHHGRPVHTTVGPEVARAVTIFNVIAKKNKIIFFISKIIIYTKYIPPS